MASGNFIIGYNLIFDNFRENVEPILNESGYFVKDKLSLIAETRSGFGKIILASIVGEGDLEAGVNNALLDTYRKLKKMQKGEPISTDNPKVSAEEDYTLLGFRDSTDKRKKNGEIIFEYHKGMYKVLGLYGENETASQLFPAIAQEYLLEDVKRKVDDLTQKLRTLASSKIRDL